MATRPINRYELLAGAEAFNEAPKFDYRQLPLANDVPTAADIPASAPKKPPKKADAGPTINVEPKVVPKQKPSPAATQGVIGPPKEYANTPSPAKTAEKAPERVPPEQDRPSFEYADQVAAGVKEAMRRGRPDIAAKIQREYADLITGQYRALEQQYEMEVLPQVHAMRKELMAYQGKAMPQELAIKANELAMQAQDSQARLLAYAYGLERNAMTAGSGIQLFNQSKLVEPGVELAQIEVRDGVMVGLDAQGQPVNFLNGQPFMVPIQEAEALYQQYFGREKEYMKLGEGDKVIDPKTGATVASNPKSPGGTPSELLSSSKAAATIIAQEFGATYDPVRQMIDESTIKDRPSYTKALAEMEGLIRGGMPPYEAANQVAQKYRAAATAIQPKGDPYSGAIPWRP